MFICLNKSNPMIYVLLATFNPNSEMLTAQIDSIRRQRDVEMHLVVREDKDGDGACANFSALLDSVVDKISCSDYLAFSDQDDIWLDDKLAKSLDKMHEMERRWGAETPLLVFTDAKVVDDDLRVLDESLFCRTKIDPERRLPNQLILQNVGNGNTMLINAALARRAVPVPKEAFMHDHWMSLVASVFGRADCLHEPTVLYRQHDRNVLGGAKVGFYYYLRHVLNGIKAVRTRLYAYIRQAAAFAAQYPEAPACFHACIGLEKRNWVMRRWLLLRHRIFKYGVVRNIGLFLFV